MIVCVLLPRFELTVAAGGRAALLEQPAALAPEPGREAFIGEVSLAAEAFGVRPGLRLGEALARCPRLALVPPDPAGVAGAWEGLLTRLESIGAAVAPERPGLASFDAQGLVRLYGGIENVVAAARRALRAPARLGIGPTAFCALAAASKARVRRPAYVTGPARTYLAPLPVALLRGRAETEALPPALERLGLATLGAVAAMPRAAMADRFGAAGVRAHALASGEDARLVARTPLEPLTETLELPEAGSGIQLERALALLVDRLLARRERRGRTLRSVVLSARLVEGGTWREQLPFREPLADGERMRLALGVRLRTLPAPAEALELARGALRAAGRRPALARRRGRRAPRRAPARGRAAGPRGGRRGRGAARARARPRLPRPRAPRRADAVRGRR